MPLKCLKGPSYSANNLCVHNLDGLVSAAAMAGGQKCFVDPVVSSANVTPLLGRDLIRSLGLSIQGVPSLTIPRDA